MSAQFPRFLVAGGVAALANFGSRFVFSEFVSFELAVTLAFFVGLGSGFLLSRRYVFTDSGNTLDKEVAWYVAVNMLALAQTWLLSVYGARYLASFVNVELARACAHMAGIMLPVVTSYFGHKYFTFREKAPDDR